MKIYDITFFRGREDKPLKTEVTVSSERLDPYPIKLEVREEGEVTGGIDIYFHNKDLFLGFADGILLAVRKLMG